jgi:putative MATE family efflux protein
LKDLTQGSIPKHIVHLAIPISVGMFVQILYYIVDLYFVSSLGETALAGVSAAGNVAFMVIALSQIINVSATSLISQAVGRNDQAEANLIFNQTLLLSVLAGLGTLFIGYTFIEVYLNFITANPATTKAGMTYLYWFLPNLALQFILVSMRAGLRGTGIVMPTMKVQIITVVINILLSPVLIKGWGTGVPMGVAGAGLASSIAVTVGLIILYRHFKRFEHYISFNFSLFNLRPEIIKKMMAIGLPGSGEYMLMFIFSSVTYWGISGLGVDAQAGFGLGARIMQCIFLPAPAIAFAIPAIIGQNLGAKRNDRIHTTFNYALLMVLLSMGLITLICLIVPGFFVHLFSSTPSISITAITFIQITALDLIPLGIVFVCSGMFQGVGKTLPAFFSTASRLFTFVMPTLWLVHQSWFEIEHLWYLSVLSICIQALISLYLVKTNIVKHKR